MVKQVVLRFVYSLRLEVLYSGYVNSFVKIRTIIDSFYHEKLTTSCCTCTRWSIMAFDPSRKETCEIGFIFSVKKTVYPFVYRFFKLSSCSMGKKIHSPFQHDHFHLYYSVAQWVQISRIKLWAFKIQTAKCLVQTSVKARYQRLPLEFSIHVTNLVYQ